jgi:hypothetical protein
MRRILAILIGFLILAGLGRAAIWLMERLFELHPAVPAGWFAAGLAAAVLLLAGLYRYERAAVAAGRGRILLGLRLGALLVVAWILLAPVWSRLAERAITREVVVILDDSASMHLVDEGESRSRAEIAAAALAESRLAARLGERLRVRTVRAARGILADGATAGEGWDQGTDLAGALEAVLAEVAPDELAGVVLASDGRHNRPGRVEDVARRFGILDAPVGIVATGSAVPPRDLAVTAVRAPDTIFLGDRVPVAVEVKADGFRGTKAWVRLFRDGVEVAGHELEVPQDLHREEIRFRDQPDSGGTVAYRVEIEARAGERFAANNQWNFETAVTEDRIHVLLVDTFPRWEFRYLRNLFHGRDKSVHLQHVLFEPDRLDGQDQTPPPASAARPFGDSEAGGLPAGRDEWRKFDVIILGDLDPQRFGPREWAITRECVSERGALLVVVAGARWMPHAHAGEDAAALLPVSVAGGGRDFFQPPEESFALALTAAGREHPVTAQSDGKLENERLWAAFPRFSWRLPPQAVAEGAEILLAAAGADGAAAPADAAGLGAALQALAARRAREAGRALLVVRQTGAGKSAVLLTDQTWRLREGVGDTHHHRLWGQMLRWGAGPVLRGGSARARLGSDQLAYTADDPVLLTARLRDETLAPVFDPALRAVITRAGETVATVPLAAVADSAGLHQASGGLFTRPGLYEASLAGPEIDRLRDGGEPAPAPVAFRVVASRGPVELAETTLNRPLLEAVAALSGGRVVEPAAAAELAALFPEAAAPRLELRETPLWDHWLVFVLLGLILAAEWYFRRKWGLP